jgi:hypothetical protein
VRKLLSPEAYAQASREIARTYDSEMSKANRLVADDYLDRMSGAINEIGDLFGGKIGSAINGIADALQRMKGLGNTDSGIGWLMNQVSSSSARASRLALIQWPISVRALRTLATRSSL